MDSSSNPSNMRRKVSAFVKFVDPAAIQTPIGGVGLGLLYSYEVTPSPMETSALRLIVAFVGIVLVLSYVMTLNDYFDVEIDKQKGVRQALAEIPKRLAGASVIIFLSFGLLFVWIASPRCIAIILVIALLSTAYSAPPLRYKNVYPFSTLGEVIGAFLLFLAGYSVFAPIGVEALVVSWIPCLAITYWRLRHEVRYVKFDEATGKKTLAVVHGVGKVKLLMRLLIALDITLSLGLFLEGWLSLTFMFFLLIFLLGSFHRKILKRIIPSEYIHKLWLTDKVWGFVYFLLVLAFILFFK
ncbi:MAG: UbiA family prenyltransferase [Candidatus Bathyarchaeia archaeon]